MGEYGSGIWVNMGSNQQPSKIFWKLLFRYHQAPLGREIHQGAGLAIPVLSHIIHVHDPSPEPAAGTEPDMEKSEVFNPKQMQSCLCSHQHQAEIPPQLPR